ncbi:helix-turn-helix domain-containing protein [Aquibacillus kalidii]|uniref:helix-turn-helix domain-containing protein n=1 Tax=Aquibacillus kalidii TaxID=2762597 RepID=UPI0016486CCD|nr:helix-turn-helix transcriptional regulator [Aquibacillus kalidii]
MKTAFENIGNKINLWLKEQNLPQHFFAQRMGISPQVMSKIINGKKAINVNELSKIASIMSISVDELLIPDKESPIIQDPIMFMIGNLKNENTKEKLQFLNHVMDEMIDLEDLV